MNWYNSINEETKTNRVSDFIRDFLTMENREIPNKGKVYLEFKKRFPFTDIETLEKILSKVKKYSYHYNKLINPKAENDNQIRNQLRMLITGQKQRKLLESLPLSKVCCDLAEAIS